MSYLILLLLYCADFTVALTGLAFPVVLASPCSLPPRRVDEINILVTDQYINFKQPKPLKKKTQWTKGNEASLKSNIMIYETLIVLSWSSLKTLVLL